MRFADGHGPEAQKFGFNFHGIHELLWWAGQSKRVGEYREGVGCRYGTASGFQRFRKPLTFCMPILAPDLNSRCLAGDQPPVAQCTAGGGGSMLPNRYCFYHPSEYS
jgi:hypothetical protein